MSGLKLLNMSQTNSKKVGILTFEQFQGRKDIGSSRIRGTWPVKYWPEAELYQQGAQYETVIYQKAYFVEHAKVFKGVKIFDLCDPDFLNWAFRTKEMIDECDAVTTSTEALAEAIRKFTDKPVVCIPDRIDLEEVTEKKYHKGDAKTAVWFGYSTNFEMLSPVVTYLNRLDINLIVISDGGFHLPAGTKIRLTNMPHNWKTVYRDILEADIVLNPQSSRGRWKYKSNNKTVLSWALGMPVATNVEELKKFVSETARREEQVIRNKELAEKWDVRYSVEEYTALIESLKQQKYAGL